MRDEFKTHFKINFKYEQSKTEFFNQFESNIISYYKYQDEKGIPRVDESELYPMLNLIEGNINEVRDDTIKCNFCKHN